MTSGDSSRSTSAVRSRRYSPSTPMPLWMLYETSVYSTDKRALVRPFSRRVARATPQLHEVPRHRLRQLDEPRHGRAQVPQGVADQLRGAPKLAPEVRPQALGRLRL